MLLRSPAGSAIGEAYREVNRGHIYRVLQSSEEDSFSALVGSPEEGFQSIQRRVVRAEEWSVPAGLNPARHCQAHRDAAKPHLVGIPIYTRRNTYIDEGLRLRAEPQRLDRFPYVIVKSIAYVGSDNYQWPSKEFKGTTTCANTDHEHLFDPIWSITPIPHDLWVTSQNIKSRNHQRHFPAYRGKAVDARACSCLTP